MEERRGRRRGYIKENNQEPASYRCMARKLIKKRAKHQRTELNIHWRMDR
jgi:hypothetical protein